MVSPALGEVMLRSLFRLNQSVGPALRHRGDECLDFASLETSGVRCGRSLICHLPVDTKNQNANGQRGRFAYLPPLQGGIK